MHIVLVEDDEVIRETTQISLERFGYTVSAFEDGRDGYEFVAAHGADVVLLDLMLPTMNGASICRAIRERSTTPIIIISARSDAIDIVQALEAGAEVGVIGRETGLDRSRVSMPGLGPRTSGIPSPVMTPPGPMTVSCSSIASVVGEWPRRSVPQKPIASWMDGSPNASPAWMVNGALLARMYSNASRCRVGGLPASAPAISNPTTPSSR